MAANDIFAVKLSETNPLSTPVSEGNSGLRETANADKVVFSRNKLQEALGASDACIVAEPEATEKLLGRFQELSQEETEPTFAMVAGYMKATNTSVGDYLKKLGENEPVNLNNQIGAREVFDLTWNQLSSSTQKVAKFTCPLPRSDVPWNIIEGAFDNIRINSDRSSTLSKNEIGQAKLDLLRFGLMKDASSSYSEVYHLHPIVKELFRSKMSPNEIKIWGDLLEEGGDEYV